MDNSSQCKIRQVLEWNTELPYLKKDVTSPVFNVRGIEHYLKFHRDENYFFVDLELFDESSGSSFSSFNVEVLAFFKRKGHIYLVLGPDTVTCQLKRLLEFQEYYIKDYAGSDISHHNVMRFLFTFDSADKPKLSGSQEKRDEQSTQTDFTVVQPDLAPVQSDLEYLSLDLVSLLDNEVNPDARLHCEDGVVLAHRAILSARSKVFATMFQTDMKEKESGDVNLDHMDLQTIKLFLRFVYSGKLPVFPVEMASTLYSLGDRYDVPSLKKMCSDFMVKNVSEGNYTEYLSLADGHGDEFFKQAIIAYVIENIELMRNSRWVKFSAEHMKLALEVTQKFIDNLP